MKHIRLLNWLIEVDEDKTKEFYNKDLGLCNCIYCKNYIEASKHIDPSVMEIFTGLGINPSKPSHLSEFGEMENGLHLYIGSYHIVGKLIEGEYCTDSDWNETNTARIENFTVGIQRELAFVHDVSTSSFAG